MKKGWSKEGLGQAALVLGYVALFTMLIVNGESLFPRINRTFGPMMFLTLFCFSVLLCGLMVFYRPYMLFVDKQRKEAAELVLATTKWLGVLAAVVVIVMTMLSR